MEKRLNKLISDAGICSRREADRYIALGRVTVNGKHPALGTTVTEFDRVMLDDLLVAEGKPRKNVVEQPNLAPLKDSKPIKKNPKTTKPKEVQTKDEKIPGDSKRHHKPLRPGKYVRYNKYAAQRHAERDAKKQKNEEKE